MKHEPIDSNFLIRIKMSTLGKRKRSPLNGLTRRSRMNETSGRKVRKVQTHYKNLLCETNTINRIRQTITTGSLYTLFYSNGVFSGNTGFNRHSSVSSYYLIGIVGYASSGTHANHSISAIRRGPNLYVFDPWGSERKDITDSVAIQLATELRVINIHMYNGQNLQAKNTTGVCVGFASDFLVRFSQVQNINNQKIEQAFRLNSNDPRTMANRLTRYNIPGPMRVVPRIE